MSGSRRTVSGHHSMFSVFWKPPKSYIMTSIQPLLFALWSVSQFHKCVYKHCEGDQRNGQDGIDFQVGCCGPLHRRLLLDGDETHLKKVLAYVSCWFIGNVAISWDVPRHKTPAHRLTPGLLRSWPRVLLCQICVRDWQWQWCYDLSFLCLFCWIRHFSHSQCLSTIVN